MENSKNSLTDKFNTLLDFIENDATPEQARAIKLKLREKIKEFNLSPETAIVDIRLSTAKQTSGTVLLLEQTRTKFSKTSRSVQIEELEKLDLSKYDSVSPLAQEYIEAHLAQ